MVALERVFAGTPRGAALINRIKADPTLSSPKSASCRRQRLLAFPKASRRQADRDGWRTTRPRPAAAAAPAAAPQRRARRSTSAARGARRVQDRRRRSRCSSTATRRRSSIFRRSARRWCRPSVLKPNQRVRMALNDQARPSGSTPRWPGRPSRSRRQRPALSRRHRVPRRRRRERSTRICARHRIITIAALQIADSCRLRGRGIRPLAIRESAILQCTSIRE